MIRLYISPDLLSGAGIVLDREQSHYLVNVMRAGVSDEVALFNGRDGEWLGRVVDASKKACRLRLERQLRPQVSPPDLDLVVALVKRGRLETIIEKAAELGARRVRLVTTRHTNTDHTNLARLQTIGTEAAEQTGRLDVPQIIAPEKLAQVLDGWDASRRLMFCDEAGDAQPILSLQGDGAWAVLIGPEGGFSAEERERLRAESYVTPVTLGPRILRADTAAIAALALWQARLGDWQT